MASRAFIESREEMEHLLREEVVGYLGLAMDGNPYVVPLNYGYVDGKILFHGAFTGKKMAHLKANPQVCFTVARQSGQVRRHGEGDPCHVDNDSVICYGTARVIEDVEERQAVLTTFNRCFRADADELSLDRAKNCAAVEITITEMTGRQEREQKTTYWRHVFRE